MPSTTANDPLAHHRGLPSLLAQLPMSLLLGSVRSRTLRAVSAPATGRPVGSSWPICTSTEAWSQYKLADLHQHRSLVPVDVLAYELAIPELNDCHKRDL